MRVGVISDTHNPSVGPEPPGEVVSAFKGVDVIIHAGDIYQPSCLDWLEEIAPVYAVELGQHPENPDGLLKNHLDEFNRYFVAIIDGQLAGYISITPPGGGEYSLDGYIPREQWPFEVSETLFEVRLLTIVCENRGSLLAPALMYAAFRVVEACGGERMMVIGRTEIASIYQSSGFQDHGIELTRGAVNFQQRAPPAYVAGIGKCPAINRTSVSSIPWPSPSTSTP